MTRRIEISIAGEPVPQPRPKAQIISRFGQKSMAKIYTPDTKTGGGLKGWKQLLSVYIRAQAPPEPWDGPVSLELTFYISRTQDLQRPNAAQGVMRHWVRPDVDNFAKAVMDVMTDVGVWKDDGRVCDLFVRKRYIAKGYAPGVCIVAELLNPQESFL